jgi:thiol-disulfide isomerase/thioredoxin
MKKYLLGLSYCLLLCSGANAQKIKAEQTSKLDSGKTIHFVDMTDINGKKIKAGSLAGKIVVMNFWFIGCPPCRYEIPQLSKIAEDYKNNRDIIFIAIATDSVGAIKEFLKYNAFHYRLIGDGAKLSEDYGVKTCPLSLVINKEGTIIFNSYTERYMAAVSGRIMDILKNKFLVSAGSPEGPALDDR